MAGFARAFDVGDEDQVGVFERLLVFLEEGLGAGVGVGAEYYDHAVAFEVEAAASRLVATSVGW